MAEQPKSLVCVDISFPWNGRADHLPSALARSITIFNKKKLGM